MPASCTEALIETLERYGRPEIFNTDRGSHFTGLDFTSVLKEAGIAISMDGSDRCLDNIFIEHRWRSLKYEAVDLHELSDGLQASAASCSLVRLCDSAEATLCLWGATFQAKPTKRNAARDADQALRLACPSAGSNGTTSRARQALGGMTDYPEYTLTRPPNCPAKWDYLTLGRFDHPYLVLQVGAASVIRYRLHRRCLQHAVLLL